jgi:hypothetical protein
MKDMDSVSRNSLFNIYRGPGGPERRNLSFFKGIRIC